MESRIRKSHFVGHIRLGSELVKSSALVFCRMGVVPRNFGSRDWNPGIWYQFPMGG